MILDLSHIVYKQLCKQNSFDVVNVVNISNITAMSTFILSSVLVLSNMSIQPRSGV